MKKRKQYIGSFDGRGYAAANGRWYSLMATSEGYEFWHQTEDSIHTPEDEFPCASMAEMFERVGALMEDALRQHVEFVKEKNTTLWHLGAAVLGIDLPVEFSEEELELIDFYKSELFLFGKTADCYLNNEFKWGEINPIFKDKRLNDRGAFDRAVSLEYWKLCGVIQ